MSYRTGIIAAQDGKTIDDTPQAYRSDFGHLLVDTRPEANHIGIYEGKCGSELMSIVNGTKEEIFFRIPHNLPFIPRVSVYMLIRDAPAALAPIVGWYAGGYFFSEGFLVNESVFVRVDEKNVYLVRRFSNGLSNSYSSQFQDVLIRAKYIINSNEMANAPYEVSLPII